MSALVPVLGKRALYSLAARSVGALSNKRARTAAYSAAGSLARMGAKYAARRIQKAWRRRRARRARGAQVAPRSIRRKRDPARVCRETVQDSLTHNQLYVQDLTTLIDGGTDPADADREYIDVVGIKLCHIVTNTDANHAIVYHMAVLEPRYGTFPPTTGTLEDAIRPYFFTNNDSSDTGYQPKEFDGIGLTRTMKHCLPICKKTFKVWMHKKCTVQTPSTGGRELTMYSGSNTRYCTRYIKINTRYQRRFDSSQKPLLLVRWWDCLDVTVDTPPVLAVQMMNKIYHRNKG